jgi:hypothetical protein
MPLHKAATKYSSPESSKKPKPVKYVSKYMVKGGQSTGITFRSAQVTALRYDGTVNLLMNGHRYQGVPTMAEYDPRNVGDKVRVVFQNNGNPLVLGKIASDDFTAAPTIFPAEYQTWTWAIGTTNQLNKFISGIGNIVGRKSEKQPVNDADYYLRLGIGYWNGTTNIMNGPADTVKNIDIYLERDEWDEGYEGGAAFTLFAAGYNELPMNPGAYQTWMTPGSIDFTLEPGELKIITLPESWRNSIGASSLNSTSIRSFVIEPQSSAPNVGSTNAHAYGRFTNLTGALRIYE